MMYGCVLVLNILMGQHHTNFEVVRVTPRGCPLFSVTTHQNPNRLTILYGKTKMVCVLPKEIGGGQFAYYVNRQIGIFRGTQKVVCHQEWSG